MTREQKSEVLSLLAKAERIARREWMEHQRRYRRTRRASMKVWFPDTYNAIENRASRIASRHNGGYLVVHGLRGQVSVRTTAQALLFKPVP